MTERILIPVMPFGDAAVVSRLTNSIPRSDITIDLIPKNERAVRNLADYDYRGNLLEEYLQHEPKTALPDLCKKYDVNSVRDLIAPQMVYDMNYSRPDYRSHYLSNENRNFEQYRELLHRTLDYLDNYINEHDSVISLQFVGAEVLRRSVQVVADGSDMNSLWVGFSPIDGKSSIYHDESVTWCGLEATEYTSLTDTEIQRAEELIKAVREQQPIVGSDRINASSTSTTLLENLSSKIRRVWEEGVDIDPIVRDWLRENVVRRVSIEIAKRKYLSTSESSDLLEEDFVFYPLQFHRESRVTVRAPEFYNQSWLVEYLSRKLPPGHDLFTKDHPQQLGAQPLSVIDTIIRHSEALAPELNAHDVIEASSAVVTLNNTVGYEAILHGKPVVVLGDAFYSNLGYTYDVTEISELDATLNDAVSSEGLSEKEVVEFAHAIIEASVAGEWNRNSMEAVDVLSESIYNHIEQM